MITVQIEGDEPSMHRMTSEEWKLMRKLLKKVGDGCWCNEAINLAAHTQINPDYVINSYDNSIERM